MQFQADIIGCPVLRSSSTYISPLGAAFLAGLAVGLWADEAEIDTLVPPRDCFEPQMSSEQRETMYAEWREAVARTVFDPSTGPWSFGTVPYPWSSGPRTKGGPVRCPGTKGSGHRPGR
jgi:hypothetical protein